MFILTRVLPLLINLQRLSGRRTDAQNRQPPTIIPEDDCKAPQVEETHIRPRGWTAGRWRLGQALQVFQQATQKVSAEVDTPVSLIVELQNLLEL